MPSSIGSPCFLSSELHTDTCNIDESTLLQLRYFPQGFEPLVAGLHARGFMAGIYTDRGTQQCGPSPGSLAHEAMDAAAFARWGFDYVKSDDCFASLDYETGMRDYGTFARALKATGRDIYYLICGCKLGVGSPDPRVGWEQCPREAAALTGANAWRIASDDYTWSNVITNANINAAFAEFSTFRHRNDPDMLIGTPLVPGGWPSERQCPNLADWKTVRKRGFPSYSITPEQSRFQFALWCMMAASDTPQKNPTTRGH